MQSFDLEIQSLIFPGNKAIDQNKFDNCEEYEDLNQAVAEMSSIPLVLGDILINAYFRISEKRRSAISQ